MIAVITVKLVSAFAKGNSLETVGTRVTGLHFHEQSEAALLAAVAALEHDDVTFDPGAVRAHAANRDNSHFKESCGS